MAPPESPVALADWLWLIPALPLAGSLLCTLLHFASLRARRAGHGHPPAADGHGAGQAHPAPAATVDASHDAGHGGGAHAGAHGGPAGPARLAGAVAVLAMLGAFALSVLAFVRLSAIADPAARLLESSTWDWIDTGVFPIGVSMRVDPLSAVMLLVVTGVGALIHVYATGYMKHDAGFARFFAYLNLFVFAMLLLVLSSSLLGLFVGWEGVGLCSYLLIGFWYEKGWPAEAGQKAFVMNRVGDACFLVGSFLLARVFGTLDIAAIAGGVEGALAAHSGELVLAGALLFAGACGKSAQIPLFTWLPDAMAGPTPVSALIHAATMVTAGIYLVVRLNPLFAASPELLFTVGLVGACTAFVAGTTALQQRDIKKVLAYSTVSQLGYMFLGLGSGAWAAAVFHLVTHAFFKALLFLGAGSVIHGMHEEQDMHRMGGLRRHMPATFLTFLAGAAALSGLPLLSGFFSKDEILAHAFAHGGAHLALWAIGLATAAITAFYTWRMVALTFFGSERFDASRVHPHESPAVMTGPLWVLALLAVLGGVLGLPPVFGVAHLLSDWLAPVVAPGDALLARHGGLAHLPHATEWMLLGAGALVALVFAHRGFHLYKDGTAFDAGLAAGRPRLARLLADAWGLDRAYDRMVVQPVKLAGFVIAVAVDQFAIDGLVNGAASSAIATSERVRRMASGRIATYGLWMGGVAALIAAWFLIVR